MNLDQALHLAVGLRLALEPGCVRIEIAGSVRRGKPEPHDLEIVAIPKSTFVATGNLFGEMSELEMDHFEPALRDVLAGGRWEFDPTIKRNGPRYKRLREVDTGMCCDLFLATVAGWGGALAIRTGPAEFSQGLVTLALRQGKHVADGYLIHGHPKPEGGCPKGSRCPLILPTLTEAAFFSALDLEWCEPRDRRHAAETARRPGQPVTSLALGHEAGAADSAEGGPR
jgi:DNA polymerase/3'-5' exonuclease PolX